MGPQGIEIQVFVSCQKLFRFPVEPWAGRAVASVVPSRFEITQNSTRRTQIVIATLENFFDFSKDRDPNFIGGCGLC